MKPVPAYENEQWRAAVREGILLIPNVVKLLARIAIDRRVTVRS